MKVSVSKNADSTPIVVDVEFTRTMLSDAAVHAHADKNIMVAIQQTVRTMLKGSKHVEPIPANKMQAACNAVDWTSRLTPRATVSRVDRFTTLFATLSDDEKAELLETIKT